MKTIKKIVKILPWALFIIAVAAIVAEVRYINIEKENYAGYNEILAETVAELQAEADELQSKAEELEAKAEELPKEADDLQSKANFYQEQIDAYSNKPNEWHALIDGLVEQIEQVYTSDDAALDVLAADLFMKAADKIAKNDYSTFPEYTKRRWNAGVTEPLEYKADGLRYVMRYYPFYWMEDEYSNIFTGKLLDKVLDKRFVEKEGYLYIKEVKKGATEWGVVNAQLTRISEKDDEIKYSVKYDRTENGKIAAKGLTCTMTMKYEDGRYKISDTDFGNL